MAWRMPWLVNTSRHTSEAREPVRARAAQPTPDRSGFTFGVPPEGLNEYHSGAATQTDRKSLLQQLYEGYLACPWAWACVQAIARTITAGGLVTTWDGDTDESNPVAPDKPEAVLALDRLLEFVNPDQDVRQLCRNVIADLLVFGDAYIEIIWWGKTPVALYNLDSPTTTPIADVHGKVSKYVQVTDYGQRAEFDPRDVIHISLDAARPGVFGVSPMQAAMLPVTAWLFAAAVGKEVFRKGLPPAFHADFPTTAQDKDMRVWRDQYRAQNLGPKNLGTPVITKGGVTLKELQTGRIADVASFKNQCRDEIFTTFGVPPAKATVIESGNLGGGTGDAQDKTYRIDTCQPIAQIVLEKLQFHLAVQAFGVEDWHLKFPEIDYRDSEVIEKIRDMRLRSGAWTRNRYAADIGEPPTEGGDEPVLVDRQNLVLWRDMEAMSASVIARNNGPSAPATPPVPVPATPSGPDSKPGSSEDDDVPGPGRPGETLRARQLEAYQARLSAAIRRLPVLVAEASGNKPADAVTSLLKTRFPVKDLSWVASADWTGPVQVPVTRIDLEHRGKWAASHDGRLPGLKTKLAHRKAEGKQLKPVILVRTPGSKKDVVVDGHHRVLAYADAGDTVYAYVGHVDKTSGPWDELHASQAGGNR